MAHKNNLDQKFIERLYYTFKGDFYRSKDVYDVEFAVIYPEILSYYSLNQTLSEHFLEAISPLTTDWHYRMLPDIQRLIDRKPLSMQRRSSKFESMHENLFPNMIFGLLSLTSVITFSLLLGILIKSMLMPRVKNTVSTIRSSLVFFKNNERILHHLVEQEKNALEVTRFAERGGMAACSSRPGDLHS